STLYYFEVRSTASSGAVETVETNRGDYYSFRTTNDTTPPVISNILVPVKTTTSSVVTWTTNEPATSQVEWGTTSGSYPSSTTKSSVLTKEHAVTMTGLTQATTYYFRVKSQDGNPSSAEAVSSEQSFLSPTPETVTVTNTVTVSTVSSGGGSRELPRDEIPPVIKFIEIPKVTPFEALITFVTNEPTLSFVDYGQTEQYDQLAANKKFEETHAITLKNLRIGKAYNYRLKVIDKGGNDTFSENKTFRTPFLVENIDTRVEVESFDVVQEEIENALESILPSIVPPFIEEPKVASTTETTAVITWKTNIGSYSTVSYVPEGEYNPLSLNPYRLEVSETEKKVREHQMELTNLTPNTKYHFQAKSFSLPKSIGKSADLTFVTKASKIEPKIASVQKTSITVNWQTNEPATSIIDYTNLTTGKRERVIDNRQDTNHSIQLENLTPDTAYRVETLGVNKNGNILEAAGDLTVRTQKDVLAPEVTSLNISNTLIPGRTDLVQTTITWKTNEPASSIIEYQEGATKTGDTLEQREEKQNLETTDHSFTITKLSPGRIYQVRALSEDEAGNVGSSPVRMIVTPRQSESIFDVVIRNFEDSFQFVRKLR
ncbi:MAG: fibronectin type III domain-containing protein, partial [bacterium]|nr:fibronectin type III domain-containing protein [bacterium]